MGKVLSGLAVIFDLDGTLIDTAGDLAAAMNHVLEQNGRAALPVSQVRHLVGYGAKAMIRQGFELTKGAPLDERVMEQYVAQFLEYYLAKIADFSHPFPHAIEALEEMAVLGARFAICTNKHERPARLLLDSLGVDRFFDAIIGSDTTVAAKPGPAMVELCLERMALKQGVFIGDSDTDIKTAQAIDMPCLFHAQGYGPAHHLRDAFAVFETYRALPALVSRATA